MKLLLDCGSGIMMKLSEIMDINELHHIFISHPHPDHIADLGVMQHGRLIQKSMNPTLPPLQIYAALSKEWQSVITSLAHSELHELIETQTIGDFTVSFSKTSHPVTCYAIRLTFEGKTIVYTADTAYSQSVLEFSKDADLLIAESSLFPKMDGKKPGHMNIDEAIQFAVESGAKQVILTHLPVYGPKEKLQDVINASGHNHIQLAEPNMTIELS